MNLKKKKVRKRYESLLPNLITLKLTMELERKQKRNAAILQKIKSKLLLIIMNRKQIYNKITGAIIKGKWETTQTEPPLIFLANQHSTKLIILV